MAAAKKKGEEKFESSPDIEAALEALDPEPAPRAPKAKPAYRVWAHGALLHDGKLYQPGTIVDLPAHIAEAISCLELVEVSDSE